MSANTPSDEPAPEARPREPSMEEILASIRRLIADDRVLTASETRGAASQPDGFSGSLSNGTESSVRAAFDALLASRFVQHRDAVIALSREMLRPMLKAWLDDNLPRIVERLVSTEIERIARGE